MIRFASLSAAVAALVFTPAAMAQDDPDGKMVKAVEVEAVADGTPVKLVEFDGEHKFLKTSSRLRVWRSEVGYTLTVDAEGQATKCELAHKFRRTYVNKRLCEVLMEHHEFEPARDAADAPVEGHYTAKLNYMDLRSKN